MTVKNTPAAGGSINMTVKNWSGTTGTMTATGGSVTTGSGGGGGGLIKIDYVNKTYAGTAPSASGGTSGVVHLEQLALQVW
jgi:hypothetical protein